MFTKRHTRQRLVVAGLTLATGTPVLKQSDVAIVLQADMLVEEQITVARTRKTFGRCVMPSVARTIIDREEAGKRALGGEEERVTVPFGDIRGFTPISEGLTPGILLGHLNRYFDGMVDIVNRYEGAVN